MEDEGKRKRVVRLFPSRAKIFVVEIFDQVRTEKGANLLFVEREMLLYEL